MIYSSVGYCRCGAEIWIEYLRKDGGWFPRFSDSDGREITKCPQCLRKLDENELE